jgi:hypothetical protein
MAMRGERHTLDQRPGALPEIRTLEGTITFTMVPVGTPRGEQLVIRCEADGEILLSIQPNRRTRT